jgi:hypothetical protein
MLEGSKYWDAVVKIEQYFMDKYGKEAIASQKKNWNNLKEITFQKSYKIFLSKIVDKKSKEIKLGNDVSIKFFNTNHFDKSKKLYDEKCTSCGKISLQTRDNYYLHKHNKCYFCYYNEL